MNYFVYILYSKSLDKYYVGYTENIEARIAKHNSKHKGFSGKAKDWEVVYSESHDSKYEALKRETQIKKWKSSAMIEKLIRS
ncbi:MAG: GIY-YIG nuclease family protein [Bacteroidales bacterium]|nr:GIY-YIG nuclease family protein [Bacteroidales bacterium]MCF8458788.1 GIY-YIG nuclease family protein [Bacteroidales bacterium]